MRSPLEYGYGCNDFSSFLLFMTPRFCETKALFLPYSRNAGRQIQPDPTRSNKNPNSPCQIQSSPEPDPTKKGPASAGPSVVDQIFIYLHLLYCYMAIVYGDLRSLQIAAAPMPIRLISMLSDPTRPDPADHRSGAGQTPVRRKSRPAQITRICFRR